jgi:hypothetical protein
MIKDCKEKSNNPLLTDKKKQNNCINGKKRSDKIFLSMNNI